MIEKDAQENIDDLRYRATISLIEEDVRESNIDDLRYREAVMLSKGILHDRDIKSERRDLSVAIQKKNKLAQIRILNPPSVAIKF